MGEFSEESVGLQEDQKDDNPDWPSNNRKICNILNDETLNDNEGTIFPQNMNSSRGKLPFDETIAEKALDAHGNLGSANTTLRTGSESNASNSHSMDLEMSSNNQEGNLGQSNEAEGSLVSNEACTIESLDSSAESPDGMWEPDREEAVESCCNDGESSDISFGDFEGTLDEVLGLVQGTVEPVQNRPSEVSTTAATSK